MSRLEQSFKFFSRQGFKFLFLELIIVFLGVYGAFLLQSYSESQRIESEKQKVLTGVKEELEYFRIFFPGYAGDQDVAEREEMISRDAYVDFSGWRFIQPQYDYTAIEYALEASADVINYDLNAGLSKVYQELRKLQHAEDLITQIAMNYQPVPTEAEENSDIIMVQTTNQLNFKRFTGRTRDRAVIMNRIADYSNELLPDINDEFSEEKRKEIELSLISNNIEAESEEEAAGMATEVQKIFPKLSKEEIQNAIPVNNN